MSLTRKAPTYYSVDGMPVARGRGAGASGDSLRGAPVTRNRTALFVGSGVFAAGAAAVLTFFMVGTPSSMSRTGLPIVASINKPVPHDILPWVPQQAQPVQVTSVQNAAVTAAAADNEVRGEADSEQDGVEPGHPPPPPPNPPPSPAEPPMYDASGMPIEE